VDQGTSHGQGPFVLLHPVPAGLLQQWVYTALGVRAADQTELGAAVCVCMCVFVGDGVSRWLVRTKKHTQGEMHTRHLYIPIAGHLSIAMPLCVCVCV
jgi:hypothetical protein